MGDNAPVWYVTMDQFLDLVTEVVRSSGNSWSYSGRNIHEKAHPEDLMVTVSAAAETVGLTLGALSKIKPIVFETETTKKKTVK